ncbi:hypothetical protein HHI36_015982 [Cryptolaemus montrouzieri]|uniref:Ankyrin repeat and MYND domain-containing protein 1 n=1 Tax=Cryptolaemus montrouzieri TaxID=559131 RepID=A0ABD2N8R2_9CUCU
MSISGSFISDDISADSGFDDLQNPKYNYTGNFDEEGFRDRYGCQNWKKPFEHKYAGQFLFNNMHDKGFYFIKQEEGFSFYDGQFYNNKLEGYGQIIYNNGSIFEGLFKKNRRFGPGVLTHQDGTQDVGLWKEKCLIRLSLSVSSDFIPSICSSASSKIKLLRFKNIVPALSEKNDVAKNLLENLGANEKVFQEYPQLYNHHVRNEYSVFFDRRLYDLAQIGSEDSCIDVLEDSSLIELTSNYATVEDDSCPCVNERCNQLNQQIDEIDLELQKIREVKRNYEKQLQTCIQCCKTNATDQPDPPREQENDVVETVKHPSRISVISPPASRTKVHKDLDQMKVGSSIVEDIESIKQVYDDDSLNRLFINNAGFRSDQSIETHDEEESLKTSSEKYTCICAEEEIPNVDFLINHLEKLRRKERFYQTVIDFLNSVIYKEVTTTRSLETAKTVKMHVEDLLTWNNEQISIEILQHCFRYRNFERTLSFSIKSLLVGDRNVFGRMGNMEKTCVNFLLHCKDNKLDEVREDLLKHNLYPDLCDARGNTGLHFAISKDCHGVIGQLANMGANLDVFNDECLTPLLLSILRYISTINGSVLWEQAFLPEIVLSPKELDQVTQWRPHESLVSLREFMTTSRHSDLQKNAEDTNSKIRSHVQSVKSSSASGRINLNYLLSISFVDDYGKYKKAVASRKQDEVCGKAIETIKQTISILLRYGANPNVGELPLSPVLLSIFCKNVDLTENLLENHADPNTVTCDKLSGLHILASLPFSSENIQIAKKFLEYDCDPNAKCGPDHWIEQNEELIGNKTNQEIDDYIGKTPLELIFMRKDFNEENVTYQCSLAQTLLDYGGLYDQYFLGHTLLSIAVLRGNKKLIETLFPYIDGYQSLGENMGNALTVLGLNRFPSVLPLSNCKATIDELMSLGMNPFNDVYDFSNVYEFFSYDSSECIDYNVPKVRAALEAEHNAMRKALNIEGNVSKNCNKLVVAYIKEIGRNILTKIYQYQLMQYLLLFAKEDLLIHKCFENMAKFLTVQEALDCVKVLIHSKKILVNSIIKQLILKVLEFITNCTPKKKVMVKKMSVSLEDEIEKLEYEFPVPTFLSYYVLDRDPRKYDVCFHCLKKIKDLRCCPCCGCVKFCSELCNKYSNKLNTKHPCNIMFYDSINSGYKRFDPNGKIPPSGIDLLMLEARQMREQEKRIEEIKRLEEEEKLRTPSKKGLKKSQKTESQQTLQASKGKSTSFLDKAISTTLSEEGGGYKKVSSVIDIQEETGSRQPRILNCGFHCGQVIPDVELDINGNVIREQEFCECYPLYRKGSLQQKKADEEIERMEFAKEAVKIELMDQIRETDSYYLSEIYREPLSIEEIKEMEAEQLDRFIGTFGRDKEDDQICEVEDVVSAKKTKATSAIEGGEIVEGDEYISDGEDRKDGGKKKKRKSKQAGGLGTEGDESEVSLKKKKKGRKKGSKTESAESVREGEEEVEAGDGEAQRKGTKDRIMKGKKEKLHAEKKDKAKGRGRKSVEEAGESSVSVEEKSKKKKKKGDKSESELDIDDQTKLKEGKGGKGKEGVSATSIEGKSKKKKKKGAESETEIEKEKKLKKKKGEKGKGKKDIEDMIEGKSEKKKKKGTESETEFENEQKLKKSKKKKKGDETETETEDEMKPKERRGEKGEGKAKKKKKGGETTATTETESKKKKSKKGKQDGEETGESTTSVERKSRKKKTKTESETDTEKTKSQKGKITRKKEEKDFEAKSKKKKKDREDKSVGGSEKRDEKTMTKKKKQEKKRKVKEKETQADDKKLSEKTSKRDESVEKKKKKEKKERKRKLKGEKRQKEDKIEGKQMKPAKKIEKMKMPEKKEVIQGGKISGKEKMEMKIPMSPKVTKEQGRREIRHALESIKILKPNLLNPERLLDLNSRNYEEFKRISRVYQYFMELISNYFPEFDWSCFLLPFACFMDGQLYYKFAEPYPYYCRTYSTI